MVFFHSSSLRTIALRWGIVFLYSWITVVVTNPCFKGFVTEGFGLTFPSSFVYRRRLSGCVLEYCFWAQVGRAVLTSALEN